VSVRRCAIADFSKFEIIKKYPIGKGLDVFRKAFSLTYAGLNVYKSSDTVQYLSDKNKILELRENTFNIYNSQKSRARPTYRLVKFFFISILFFFKPSRNPLARFGKTYYIGE
jgi:hypothetical protein